MSQRTAVGSVDEWIDGVSQRVLALAEAARAVSYPDQVVAQFGIVALLRASLALVVQGIVNGWPTEYRLLDVDAIAEVALSQDRFMHHLLDNRSSPRRHRTPVTDLGGRNGRGISQVGHGPGRS